MENTTVDCLTACVNGCILGDKCPHRKYAAMATKFIEETSVDKMHEIADEAFRKKMTAPPQWVLPDQ
jgi:hypothetical protein